MDDKSKTYTYVFNVNDLQPTLRDCFIRYCDLDPDACNLVLFVSKESSREAVKRQISIGRMNIFEDIRVFTNYYPSSLREDNTEKVDNKEVCITFKSHPCIWISEENSVHYNTTYRIHSAD